MIRPADTSLDAVLATDQLASRLARATDSAAEIKALVDLAEEMGHPSRHVLQQLVQTAMILCRAGSAGVSLLEAVDGKKRFRWHALAGALREHLWSVAPRDASPSGVVFDHDAPQLFRYPERHFRYLSELRPLIIEELLVPFSIDGKPMGTIWVASHDENIQFDSGDAAVIAKLGRVAAAAVRANTLLEELRESTRRKDEFLTILSHEMRNPLAAMSNAAKFLADGGGSEPDQERARAVIQRQLTQITRLSEDLLDVSRVGRGTLELRNERTDLVHAVRLGREAAAPALAEYDREIAVTLPSGPIWVDGDPARLAQIVTNLLTNAARRTRSGGRASLTVSREENEAVIVASSETEGVAAGWGRKSDDVYAPPPEPIRPSESQGIGLALAQSLTEMHGGRVSAISTGGARDNAFEVRLPVLDLVETVTIAKSERPLDRFRDRRRREKVLIVDDCVDSSDSLAMLLESWGHEVRTAQGATAGLRLEWEFEPHAVILDIEMPGKNGYEVAAELRVRRRRDLMLVALSGHAREEDRARSLAAGFDHHMTKPANVDMLRRLLA